MGGAQIGLLGVLLLVMVCNVYVAWHFRDRFKKRHHPLSVTAATRQLWPIAASLLVFHPTLSFYRPLVLTTATVDGVIAAAMVYLTRRATEGQPSEVQRKTGREDGAGLPDHPPRPDSARW